MAERGTLASAVPGVAQETTVAIPSSAFVSALPQNGWSGFVGRWGVVLVTLAMLAVGIGLRFTYPMSTTDWVDRDIQRAIGLARGTHIPLVGPELNSGGFLPGPFFYLLLGSVCAFTDSPYAAVFLNQFLNIASILIFLGIMARRYPSFTVLASLGFLCFAPTHAWAFGSPINPAFIFCFNTLMVFLCIKVFVDEQDWCLLPALVTIALGTQIHLSFAGHLVSLMALAMLIHRPRVRIIALSVGCALLTFVPYAMYRLFTHAIPLYRSYQQFSPSGSFLELLPHQTFQKIFSVAPLPVAAERLRELIGRFAPGLEAYLSTEQVTAYHRFAIRFEFLAYALVFIAGTAAVVIWGYRSRFRFTTAQRLVLVPCLATVPLLLLWQWVGFPRHSHLWYSFVFYPLLPWAMGTACELATRWLKRPSWRRAVRVALLLGVLTLAPETMMYYKTVFSPLDGVVADIREIKQELGMSQERYREGVFIVDRLHEGDPEDADPPFEFPPGGTHTDYLYGAVGSDMPLTRDDPGTCHLIGHKRAVDFYSLPYYLDRIESDFGLHPSRVLSSPRLVYFAYDRPPHGNCFHNTTNAWVVSEHMGSKIARVPANRESRLLTDVTTTTPTGQWERRELEFAVADRTAMLPMTVRVSVERHGDTSQWLARLDSAHLMGQLNTMRAYAGLFRPWPKLWLDDVEPFLEGDGVGQSLRFPEDDIGVVLLTPLTIGPQQLGQAFSGTHARLFLRYHVHVAGRYEGGGADIQSLATAEGAQQWMASHLLYEGVF